MKNVMGNLAEDSRSGRRLWVGLVARLGLLRPRSPVRGETPDKGRGAGRPPAESAETRFERTREELCSVLESAQHRAEEELAGTQPKYEDNWDEDTMTLEKNFIEQSRKIEETCLGKV